MFRYPPIVRSLLLRNALAYKRLRRGDPQDRARIPLAAWIDGILLAKTGSSWRAVPIENAKI